jgi:hypothetical protein
MRARLRKRLGASSARTRVSLAQPAILRLNASRATAAHRGGYPVAPAHAAKGKRAPKAGQLFPPAGGQAVAAQTLVQLRLPDPLADRVGRRLELARPLINRAPRAGQLDNSPPLRRRVRWDAFLALRPSCFVSPQHRHPNRVKSSNPSPDAPIPSAKAAPERAPRL